MARAVARQSLYTHTTNNKDTVYVRMHVRNTYVRAVSLRLHVCRDKKKYIIFAPPQSVSVVKFMVKVELREARTHYVLERRKYYYETDRPAGGMERAMEPIAS